MAASLSDSPRGVAVFGSTGSIGRNALEVIRASRGRLRAVAISAHHRLDRLEEQAQELAPRFVIATDPQAAAEHAWSGLPKNTELLVGPEALERVAADAEVDTVLAAIVGSAGLHSTLAALRAKKRVALANKETLVMAGPLVRRMLDQPTSCKNAALANGKVAELIPVDSEHSAIFQSLGCGKGSEVERIVLTASGGPFRTWSREQLAQVTIDEALAHPTWDMGPKITIDSATMMNKALEVIEARWLFDLPVEKIGVVIHPQSTIHSMVEYVDGSIVAQLGPPDMRLPIQYALDYPQRLPGPAEKLDWTRRHHLDFEPADFDRFPALELGFQCAGAGGTSGAVLNAANEAAVQSFLEGELHFTEIVPACRSILEAHDHDANPTLDQLVELDRWAREEIHTWVCA
ncbi:1-deoxy-D-xylulose-5-phosphate reductoisomerase [Botrimarina hoheduenensis]|uniref:1-deoxy-D-xylulose 5-phosphate reductoisomerase n=1 Tax=Botrimarina hoheduenensis TaxID=2528000 RepID=A0A5C5WC46_9BACT|nr:1-deoxy-D-xylulose-5-phosphate reductoisomerase [Botrimarina hoheduenensis]TWT47232.1 1-deoxy-D-xylulose 5-phosphate reductoisomerase [Botrimarina hoheduenensis]